MQNNYGQKFIFLSLIFPNLIFAMHHDDQPGDIIYDELSRQRGKVVALDQTCYSGNVALCQQVLALKPLPGESVPCELKLQKRPARHIDKESADRTCKTYCRTYPQLAKMYQDLNEGNLVRTLISGQTGTGKSHLVYSFSQESTYPYFIADIPTTFLGTPRWMDGDYQGMKNILQQAIAHARTSKKKVIVILDDIEAMEGPSGLEYHGQPITPGTVALHEFFDRQDQGDVDARSVSIIAISANPARLRSPFIARFIDHIKINLPSISERYSTILTHLSKLKHRPDASAIQHAHDLAKMTDGFTHFDLEHLFNEIRDESERETDLLDAEGQHNLKVTWAMVQRAYHDYKNSPAHDLGRPISKNWISSIPLVPIMSLIAVGALLITFGLRLRHS